MIDEVLNKFILNAEVDSSELHEAFDEIFSGSADPIAASALAALLKVNEVNRIDVSPAVISARDSISRISLPYTKEYLFENYTFNSRLNIFDLSFAIDIVCAACGLGVVKYQFDHPYYKNKSFVTLRSLGGVTYTKSEKLLDDFEKTNFAYVDLSVEEKYFKYSSAISLKLPFFNIFNISDIMLNPCGAKNQMIGFDNPDEVAYLAEIALKLNNSNTLIVAGANGFPFVSIEAETKVAEAWKNKIFTYNITPELLGVDFHSFDEIKCENMEHNAKILLDVFKNKQKNAAYDIIVLNCAMALYITKKAESIIDGLELARRTIDDNTAYAKLEQIINLN